MSSKNCFVFWANIRVQVKPKNEAGVRLFSEPQRPKKQTSSNLTYFVRVLSLCYCLASYFLIIMSSSGSTNSLDEILQQDDESSTEPSKCPSEKLYEEFCEAEKQLVLRLLVQPVQPPIFYSFFLNQTNKGMKFQWMSVQKETGKYENNLIV